MSHRIYERGPTRYRYWAQSDIGRVRTNNEDSLIDFPDLGFFGVCDGLGGHAAGEVASAMAVATLVELLESSTAPPAEALETAIAEANRRILAQQSENPRQRGMGTTLSSLWLMEGAAPEAWVGHVGDSRIYRRREGTLEQITDDHSPVFRLYRQGLLSKDQMHYHPQKNLLERSLGVTPDVDPDIFSITLHPADRYLICSDGLTDCLLDRELAPIVEEKSLESAAGALIAAANERGGSDNITLVLLEVVETAA